MLRLLPLAALLSAYASVASSAALQEIRCNTLLAAPAVEVSLADEGLGTRFILRGPRAAQIAERLFGPVIPSDVHQIDLIGPSERVTLFKPAKPYFKCDWRHETRPIHIRYYDIDNQLIGIETVNNIYITMGYPIGGPRWLSIQLQGNNGAVFFQQKYDDVDRCQLLYDDETSEWFK